MPAQTTPPVTIAKPLAGVLPISAVTDASHAHSSPLSKNASTRPPPPQRTKLVLRRLPPGITRVEVETALGDEWKPGNGHITWAEFKPGKVSKDVSKSSKPARIYFQVADSAHLDTFAQTVAKASFVDARATANDSVLIGPPILEFAPYGRLPNSKRRNDARQGTIDQDPEFIEFLQSLTDPITKSKALDQSSTTKDEPVTVTPLIQHLRDKKAAKEKAASNKAAKHQKQDSKDVTAEVRGERKRGGKDAARSNDKENRSAKNADKTATARDTAKKPSRRESAQAARQQGSSGGSTPKDAATSAAASSSGAATIGPDASTTTAPSKRLENSAAGSAAARIIQRDLGLRNGGRGGSRSARASKTGSVEARAGTPTPADPSQPTAVASRAAGDARPQPANSTTTSQPAATGSRGQAPTTAPTQPAQTKSTANSRNAAGGKGPGKSTPADPTATRAFLKHANASQAITEAAIARAMAELGAVASVDVDRRKGFAIVAFAQPAGLAAALAASPVTIAQGSVQVLEYKERPPAPPQQQQQPRDPAASAAAGAPAGNAPQRGGRNAGGGSSRGGGSRGRGRGGASQRGGAASNAGAGAGGGGGTVVSPVAQGGSTADGAAGASDVKAT